jgi:ABC-type glycerol-3-phosphate transport system substrate-binding protein
MFVSGKAAFFNSIISDAFNWKLWGDTMGYDNFGVMKFPKIEKDYPLNGVSPVEPGASLMDLHGGIAFALPKWSKNQDDAVKYIEYVTSPEVQTRYLLEGGAIPANKKFDQSVVKASQFKTIMKWVNEPGVSPPGLLYMGPEEWDALIRQTQLLITGQTNVDGFAKAMQAAEDKTR